MARQPSALREFKLEPGRMLAGKYEVISLLGSGWEGEVYKIRERNTQVERAAKLFFPHRNINNRTSNFYARKLHKLRECPILIQYHTQDFFTFRQVPITMLISEYVEGELLDDFLRRQPRKTLNPFCALHLLYAMVMGLEPVHMQGEYHGDLHTHNVIVSRFGLHFQLKMLDMFHWKAPKKENLQGDICDVIRIFYDALGGAKAYSKQGPSVKNICNGLKRTLILKKFPTMTRLRQHIETMHWE